MSKATLEWLRHKLGIGFSGCIFVFNQTVWDFKPIEPDRLINTFVLSKRCFRHYYFGLPGFPLARGLLTTLAAAQRTYGDCSISRTGTKGDLTLQCNPKLQPMLSLTNLSPTRVIIHTFVLDCLEHHGIWSRPPAP